MSALRLGVIGLASSHVPQWIRYVTQPEAGADTVLQECTVSALGFAESEHGDAVDRSRINVLQQALRHPPVISVGPPNLVALDLVGKIDAVVIGDRHHASHYEHALPFVRLGIPVFIDKPMASTLEEVDSLLAQAQSAAAVQSYSAMRFDPLVLSAAAERSGSASHVTVTGGADPASPYGGAAFYSVHTIEMGLALAPGHVDAWHVRGGGDEGVHSLRVVSKDEGVQHVTDIDVELSASRQSEPFVIAGEDGTIEVPVAGDYLLPGFVHWLSVLRGEATPVPAAAMRLTVELTQTLPPPP